MLQKGRVASFCVREEWEGPPHPSFVSGNLWQSLDMKEQEMKSFQLPLGHVETCYATADVIPYRGLAQQVLQKTPKF